MCIVYVVMGRLSVEIIIGAIALTFTCAEVITALIALITFKSIEKEA